MRILIFVFILLVTSCAVKDAQTSDLPQAGKSLEEVEILGQGISIRSSTVCLRDRLTGEDDGGTWTLVSPTGGFAPDLTGDSPCVDFSTAPPALYVFRYTLYTLCCQASSTISIRKCGLSGTSTCSF